MARRVRCFIFKRLCMGTEIISPKHRTLHPVAAFATLVSPRGEGGTWKQTSQAPQPHRADLVRDFVQVRQAKAQSTSSKRGETYKAGNAGTQTLANKAAPAKISAELVADQKTK